MWSGTICVKGNPRDLVAQRARSGNVALDQRIALQEDVEDILACSRRMEQDSRSSRWSEERATWGR